MPEAQTSNTPAADAGTNDIANVMGGMQSEKPAEKPTGPAGGENDAGSKTAANGNNGGEVKHPAWMAQLGNVEAEKAEKLSKFEKIGDLANNYLELEKKLGSSLVKPSDDASDEEKEAFYRALGKPESADKYSIEGEEAEMFRKMAYDNNLTDAQAKAFYKTLQEVGNNAIAQQKAAFDAQARDTQAALQKEYGKDYPTKIEMLKRGVAAYGGEKMGAKLKDAGLLGDYDVVKMFILLGEQSAEAGSPGTTKGKANGYKTTAEGGTFNFGDYFKNKK